MYSEVNQEIFELKEKLRIKEKLESLRDMRNKELQRKKANRNELYNELNKEKRDVEKLEGMSFSSVFLSIIGKKEDKLDKEREEFLAAELRYEECVESIKELEREIEDINRELINYSGVRRDYDRLIKEKEQLVMQDDGVKGNKLRNSLDKINELKLDIKEVREAINAGEKACSSLEEMRKHLDSAKSWGTWDILGGGLISNIAKHSAIDDANKVAHEAQYLLKSFEKELSDVNKFTEVKVNISGFTTFADFFFDGFFVDWFVQSKIKDSLTNVENVYDKIDNIVNDLRKSLYILEEQLRETEREIKTILEF